MNYGAVVFFRSEKEQIFYLLISSDIKHKFFFSFMNFCDKIFLLGFREINCGTFDFPKSLSWFKILIVAVSNFGSSWIQEPVFRVLFFVDPKIL